MFGKTTLSSRGSKSRSDTGFSSGSIVIGTSTIEVPDPFPSLARAPGAATFGVDQIGHPDAVVRFVFTAYLLLIAVGLVVYISIGIVNP
jgi:hypothetical protein